jgi:hypothetical protein
MPDFDGTFRVLSLFIRGMVAVRENAGAVRVVAGWGPGVAGVAARVAGVARRWCGLPVTPLHCGM